MDRAVHTAPNPVPSLKVRGMAPCDVFGPTVVLELKFRDRFPKGFNDLVQTLEQRRAIRGRNRPKGNLLGPATDVRLALIPHGIADFQVPVGIKKKHSL